MNTRLLAPAFLTIALAGCFTDNRSSKENDPEKARVIILDGESGSSMRPPDFRPRLLEIAKEYKDYEFIDGKPRWAPAPCAAASSVLVSDPTKPQFSASSDEDTHGRKLYNLFAKQTWGGPPKPGSSYTPSYTAMPGGKAPVGQVIVKQSWVPEVVPAADAKGPELLNFVARAGKLYRRAMPADLFVMYKLEPGTPGTHDGWVYGVVTPDGKTVKEAGRLANCMGCHQEAPHDKLFGLPAEKRDTK